MDNNAKLVQTLTNELNELHQNYQALKESYRIEKLNHEQTAKTLNSNLIKYRTIFESANDAIFLMTGENFIDCNLVALEMFGIEDKNEILMHSPVDFSPELQPDGISSVEKALKFITNASEGNPQKFYWKHIKKNGTPFTAEVSLTRMELNGEYYLLSIVRDITERKIAEKALKESEEKYRFLFENVQDIYYKTDLNGTILDISPSVKIYSQYSMEDLLGKNVNDLYKNKEDRSVFISRLMETGKVNDYEILLKSKTNEYRYASMNARLVKDLENNEPFIVGALRDITERKLIEEELITARDKAEESDRLKSAFLANISHEIRTPMNGIMGFAHLLKEPDLSQENQQKFVSMIERSGERMLNIINEVIDISKIESGTVVTKISKFNINEVIEYVFELLYPEARQKRLDMFFKCGIQSQKAIIKTDKEKFIAIFTNLVKNAIKYTDKGHIEFGYEAMTNNPDQLEFTTKDFKFYVKDSGIGIPKERQKVIFERFIKADIEDREARQGAGLGLSISKAYIEMLGGKIELESAPGVGSSFYFSLGENSSQHKHTNAKTSLQVADIKSNDQQLLNILIADDDEVSIQVLNYYLKSSNKRIHTVISGEKAVLFCKTCPDLDLILMDLKMPGLNGLEATKQIREFNKNVIIIAQTAFALAGDREKALQAGCDDYISKPIKKDELSRLIEKYFNPES